MEQIRVRIAPSPSGNLHIGTARTALFNYLFAKKHNGKFVLRIEDTDLERSSDEYIKNIFDSLKALGLQWDEGPDVGGEYGPYSQSQRFETYQKYAQILIDKGYAYECFCTPEELEEEKRISQEKKIAHIYSGKCKNLTDAQKKELRKEGRKPAIRFSVEARELIFNDLVKGELKLDTGLIGDFVIMKSNGSPTYNFAVVIDDMLMKISHIIRGEDHISNTPKQILIYEALGAKVPQFGHLGMILAPDRSKLSKRHGATAVSEFIEKGYLTEALVNFVALLGWSPSDGVEIKTVDEIAADFRIHEVSSSNSIFEYDKLNWMNSQYIKKLGVNELKEKLLPFLKDYDLSELSEEKLTRMIEITREPLVILSDITDAVSYLFGQGVNVEPEVQSEVLDTEISQTVLKEVAQLAQNWNFDDEEALHHTLEELRNSFKERGIKPKETMWAIRAAVTGRTKGADICAVLWSLGREKVLNRINKALK
ncbi:MAG TPA: glutamate--tRNA ligase [Candidatus Gastranaerophilaceae bacterium]|nr:glutamate--tRNA ligase [Candidatus Gastranaerophilaceae bacterium]HPT41798.1 glutamate--tRNA ligase [Candidatus Gastranaerophilaceae bacterium]